MSSTQDVEARNRLLVQYRFFPRWLVRRLFWMPLVKRLGRDEAESAGFVGLIRAARRFDPARGVKFTTFAFRYVRGAILAEATREARKWRLRHLPDHYQVPQREPPEGPDMQAVHVALRRIPARMREVLLLRFLHENTLLQVGGALGVNRQRAAVLVDQALEKVRRELLLTRKDPNGYRLS